jgi:ribosomal protein S12 methylthiotransferase accessory factor
MKIKVDYSGKKQVNAHFKNFNIATDQPITSGGEELAPTPFELFLSSMVTCAGIYVRDFCNNRSLPTDGITLEQEVVFNKESKLLEKVSITIKLPSNFIEKYDDAIIHTASLCLVKRQLNPAIVFDVAIVRGSDI